MAQTKCGSCGGALFEAREGEPINGRYKQTYIQCRSCGVPIGVVGSIDADVVADEIRSSVHNLKNESNSQSQALQQLDYRLARIEQLLAR